jgi:DNA-binding protein HU-beta
MRARDRMKSARVFGPDQLAAIESVFDDSMDGLAPEQRSVAVRYRIACAMLARAAEMATVGYKELNESGEFVVPGFAKISVVNKPATDARSGVNPFKKEPMDFAAKPASKTVKASPLKVTKDAV